MAAIPNWADGGAVKIERANEHIADLERQGVAFFETAPFKLVAEEDEQTQHKVYRWRAVVPSRPIPRIWGAIAGDAIHNLRSALDVLWRQATCPKLGSVDQRKAAHFPFPKSGDALQARLAGEVQPRLKAALEIAVEFEPYQPGNEDLWLLNQASAVDKHEVPTLVSAVWLQSVRIKVWGPSALGWQDTCIQTLARPKRIEALKDGAEFAREEFGQRLELDDDHKPSFAVAFGECGPLEGKAVLPTLRVFAGITTAIAEAFIRDGLLAVLAWLLTPSALLALGGSTMGWPS